MVKQLPIDSPRPGGIPDPTPNLTTLVEIVQDATWFALGRTPAHRVYISVQGDWWDMIAIRVYGRQRGNEHLMYRLIEANYALREVTEFAAGIQVIVPEVELETVIPLVPWKNASRIP